MDKNKYQVSVEKNERIHFLDIPEKFTPFEYYKHIVNFEITCAHNKTVFRGQKVIVELVYWDTVIDGDCISKVITVQLTTVIK